MGLSLAMSCSKNPPPPPGGTWTFGSNTYDAVSCIMDTTHYTLTAYNTVTGSTYSNIAVSFYNALPDTGSYIVKMGGNLTAPNQASINLAYQTATVNSFYTSILIDTGANHILLVQKIKVTRTNGKLGVSGSGIYIAPTSGPADTLKLNFGITQTQ